MFFSERESGHTPALLPKPYYKLGGFGVGRRGGLRRRFELEIGGCYTWWSPCIPVLEASGRVWQKILSYDTCCFLYLLSDIWNHWDRWTFGLLHVTSRISCVLHWFPPLLIHCIVSTAVTGQEPRRATPPLCPFPEAEAVHYLILAWFNSSQVRFQQVFSDLQTMVRRAFSWHGYYVRHSSMKF